MPTAFPTRLMPRFASRIIKRCTARPPRATASAAVLATVLAVALPVGFADPAAAAISSPVCQAAAQASDGNLSTYNTTNGVADLGLGMAPGTSPAITAVPGGSFEEAFQANTGVLWEDSASGAVDTGQGMAAGTSPVIAGLADGGFEVAFQANTGALIVYGTGGDINTDLGMMPGTNPAILAFSNGGFEVAFEANTGVLWYYSTSSGGVDTGQGMAAGTSPSIAPVAGTGTNFEIAFQANNGGLILYGNADNITTGIAMEPGTSPSLYMPPLGSTPVVAYVSASDYLYTYVPTVGAEKWLAIAAGSSPSITPLPNITSLYGYEIAYESTAGQLWLSGTYAGIDTGLDMAESTSTAIIC
jgi:hypothetical protein